MKQYGSYSDEDLTYWEHLPLPSKVLTQSIFGAWLMRRDEHRDKSVNLISINELEDIKKNRYNQGFYDGYKKATEQANAVIDDIKAELDQYLTLQGFGTAYRQDVLAIVDKHISGKRG